MLLSHCRHPLVIVSGKTDQERSLPFHVVKARHSCLHHLPSIEARPFHLRYQYFEVGFPFCFLEKDYFRVKESKYYPTKMVLKINERNERRPLAMMGQEENQFENIQGMTGGETD